MRLLIIIFILFLSSFGCSVNNRISSSEVGLKYCYFNNISNYSDLFFYPEIKDSSTFFIKEGKNPKYFKFAKPKRIFLFDSIESFYQKTNNPFKAFDMGFSGSEAITFAYSDLIISGRMVYINDTCYGLKKPFCREYKIIVEEILYSESDIEINDTVQLFTRDGNRYFSSEKNKGVKIIQNSIRLEVNHSTILCLSTQNYNVHRQKVSTWTGEPLSKENSIPYALGSYPSEDKISGKDKSIVKRFIKKWL